MDFHGCINSRKKQNDRRYWKCKYPLERELEQELELEQERELERELEQEREQERELEQELEQEQEREQMILSRPSAQISTPKRKAEGGIPSDARTERRIKMKIDISHMMQTVAKELAHSDDGTQSDFLNQFAKELQIICRGKTESQLCYLSDKLDRDGIYLIEELHEFISLRKTQRANP